MQKLSGEASLTFSLVPEVHELGAMVGTLAQDLAASGLETQAATIAEAIANVECSEAIPEEYFDRLAKFAESAVALKCGPATIATLTIAADRCLKEAAKVVATTNGSKPSVLNALESIVRWVPTASPFPRVAVAYASIFNLKVTSDDFSNLPGDDMRAKLEHDRASAKDDDPTPRLTALQASWQRWTKAVSACEHTEAYNTLVQLAKPVENVVNELIKDARVEMVVTKQGDLEKAKAALALVAGGRDDGTAWNQDIAPTMAWPRYLDMANNTLMQMGVKCIAEARQVVEKEPGGHQRNPHPSTPPNRLKFESGSRRSSPHTGHRSCLWEPCNIKPNLVSGARCPRFGGLRLRRGQPRAHHRRGEDRHEAGEGHRIRGLADHGLGEQGPKDEV